MTKENYSLYQLNNDKKALFFCLFIIFVNVFYLYENNDSYFILGAGSGLVKVLNLNAQSNYILDMNAFFLRAFSYMVNMIFFNFIFLMLYNIVFKRNDTFKIEALFVYFVNIILIIGILYVYLIMR